MGGKSYYCDYCNCFMKNDVAVRKLHNAGLAHTVAKVSYMKQFENPRKLLLEERLKKPCKRYFSGYCKFEMFCQFGHFSEAQLAMVEKIVKQQKKSRKGKNAWQFRLKRRTPLPPSLQGTDKAKVQPIQFLPEWE